MAHDDLDPEPEILWPESGDSLTTSPDGDGLWWQSVSFDSNFDRWGDYASGFLRSARLIIEDLSRDNPRDRHLAYPLVSNYRHAIELEMKRNTVALDLLHGTSPAIDHTHDLSHIWGRIVDRLEQMDLNYDSDDVHAAGDLIRQLEELDPRSVAFRYPADGTGARSVPTTLQINLRQFSERCEAVINFLLGNLDYVDDLSRAGPDDDYYC